MVPEPLITHRGGCHCGAVTFEVDAPARVTVRECNCSICRMSGYLHLIVPPTHFRLLRGAEAQQRTLEFLTALVTPGSSPMCGNSICQDRRFLARSMPELERFFHYRNLDVSTLKELAHRWMPALAAGYSKQGAHLARADIYESIGELRYYRERMFVKP